MSKKDKPIVERAPVAVAFVLGIPGLSNAEQVQGGIRRLEARLSSRPNRRFFGAEVAGEYRICVALEPGDEKAPLAHWKLPGGFYRRTDGGNWRDPSNRVANVIAALTARKDYDRSRPLIERFSTTGHLTLFAPVRGFGPTPREPQPPPGRPSRTGAPW